MKTIPLRTDTERDAVCDRVARVIQAGGIVCLPYNGRYRVVADLGSPEAVMRLMQSKGRVRKAPALVLIGSEAALGQVASEVEPLALNAARKVWPLPLTIRVKPSDDLPGKVRKQLGGAKSKIGVRIPSDPLMREVVDRVGRPLLVSSANRDRKSGAQSPAQVRKTFGATVDLFVDRGDLQPGITSTVIDVRDGELVVEREGTVDEKTLRELLG